MGPRLKNGAPKRVAETGAVVAHTRDLILEPTGAEMGPIYSDSPPGGGGLAGGRPDAFPAIGRPP